MISRYPTLLAAGTLFLSLVSYGVCPVPAAQTDLAWAAETLCSDYSGEPRTWVRAEYLHWWIKGNDLPPLVTTSPMGTPQAVAGVLSPGTDVLFGDGPGDTGARPGVRAAIGHWFDDSKSFGVEAAWSSVFGVAGGGGFFIASDGDPIVARPFFEVNLQQNAAELTAFTNPIGTVIAEGSIGVRTSSELQSASLLLRVRDREGTRGRLDLLGGYRFLRFQEGLVIDEQVIARDPGGLVPVGTTFQLTDRFSTENNFHGGEFGLATEFVHEFLSLQFLGKVALGNIRQEIHRSGDTVLTIPPPVNATSTTAGGLLTQPTNIGTRVNNEFAVLPEFGINATVLLTERLTFTTGYSLLLLNHVARSGEQIDTVLNSTQIGGNALVGPARPQPTFADSDFWAQGLQFGFVFEH